MHGEVPPRDVLLKFIADNPDRASKREIAKAFGIKGDDRVVLKAMLRELEDEGLLQKKRKSLMRPGALPPVTVLDITTRDKDGELIGRPAEWPEEEGAAPAVLIRQSGGGKNGKRKVPTAGLNDRVVAKIFPSKSETGPAYTARIIKVIDKRRAAALGVIRMFDDGSARLMPIDRRDNEIAIDEMALNGAKDGDLVEVDVRRSGRYGLPRGEVLTIVGSLASEKAVSMIAIHAHGIPHIFPKDVIDEADAATPATMKNREDWRDVPLVTIDPDNWEQPFS